MKVHKTTVSWWGRNWPSQWDEVETLRTKIFVLLFCMIVWRRQCTVNDNTRRWRLEKNARMEIAWPFSLSPNFLCDWMIGDYINIKTRQCGTHQNRSCSRHNNNEHWFLMQCIDRVYRPCFPYTKFLHHPLHQQIRLNKSLLCMQSVRILFDIKHSMCLLHVIHIIRVQTLGY